MVGQDKLGQRLPRKRRLEQFWKVASQIQDQIAPEKLSIGQLETALVKLFGFTQKTTNDYIKDLQRAGKIKIIDYNIEVKKYGKQSKI